MSDVTEEIRCYNCRGSGKVKRAFIFLRDCPICVGTGSIKLVYDQTMLETAPDLIAHHRVELRFGLKRRRVGTPA